MAWLMTGLSKSGNWVLLQIQDLQARHEGAYLTAILQLSSPARRKDFAKSGEIDEGGPEIREID